MAGIAYCEKIFTLSIMFAVLQIFIVFDKSIYPASHKNMGMGVMILLDLFKAFICPVDAIPAINHKNPVMGMRNMGAF
jgi:hypothetical protein